ncbi:hypothetical protein QTP86_032709, partial [Hemibagrus guttatus]
MLEHGVCYGQAVTSTEVQQQDTTRVQIRWAVPPNHAPPGITVVAHMGVEVPQQNYGVPSRSTFQHPSQGLQEGWVLHTAIRPISRNNSETPIPGPKARGNNPLVYRGKLQHMAAELGGYKQAHPSPTPLTMGHSREEESPISLKELALTHQGMDSTRSLKVCCGIWHQDVSSRSIKSWKECKNRLDDNLSKIDDIQSRLRSNLQTVTLLNQQKGRSTSPRLINNPELEFILKLSSMSEENKRNKKLLEKEQKRRSHLEQLLGLRVNQSPVPLHSPSSLRPGTRPDPDEQFSVAHTHSHSHTTDNQPTMHVFGLGEETGVPGGNPQGTGRTCKLHTHGGGGNRTPNPGGVRQTCKPPSPAVYLLLMKCCRTECLNFSEKSVEVLHHLLIARILAFIPLLGCITAISSHLISRLYRVQETFSVFMHCE